MRLYIKQNFFNKLFLKYKPIIYNYILPPNPTFLIAITWTTRESRFLPNWNPMTENDHVLYSAANHLVNYRSLSKCILEMGWEGSTNGEKVNYGSVLKMCTRIFSVFQNLHITCNSDPTHGHLHTNKMHHICKHIQQNILCCILHYVDIQSIHWDEKKALSFRIFCQ